jgi:predicted RNA-binding Zn-ribbon protein involved in translation (DUF1610 family)
MKAKGPLVCLSCGERVVQDRRQPCPACGEVNIPVTIKDEN